MSCFSVILCIAIYIIYICVEDVVLSRVKFLYFKSFVRDNLGKTKVVSLVLLSRGKSFTAPAQKRSLERSIYDDMQRRR